MNEVIEKMLSEQRQQVVSLQNDLIAAHLEIENLHEKIDEMNSEMEYYKRLLAGTEGPVNEFNELIREMKTQRNEYKLLITQLKLLRKNMI